MGSNYAINQLAKYPQLVDCLEQLTQFELHAELLTEKLQATDNPELIKQELRLFRHQKLIEIIFLDICKDEPVKNTLVHLS